MNAVILCGGSGAEMMPMTYYAPKAMLPVLNRPLIDYSVSRAEAAGVTDITVLSETMTEHIEAYIKGYTNIRINCENVADGGAAKALKRIAESGDSAELLILSADFVSNADIKRLIATYRDLGSDFAAEAAEATDVSGHFALKVKDKRIESIALRGESEIKAGLAYAGACVADVRLVQTLPEKSEYCFFEQILPDLAANAMKAVYSEVTGYQREITCLNDFYKANFDAVKRAFPRSRHAGRSVEHYIGSSFIADSAIVSGKVRNCIIGEGAIVTSAADLSDCIVLKGEMVEQKAQGKIIGGVFSLSPEYGNVNLNNVKNPTKIFRIFA